MFFRRSRYITAKRNLLSDEILLFFIIAQHNHVASNVVDTEPTEVYNNTLTKVQAHEEVGRSQVADEEPGDVYFTPSEYQHEYHGSVSQHGQQEHDPYATSQRPPVEQILARQERTY